MKNIDLNKCTYSCSISVDENDCFNDFLNGKYGYRVFYDVPKEEMLDINYFSDYSEEEIAGGQIEFTIDANGKQVGEVLLWITIDDGEDGLANDDFCEYDNNVALLVEDFTKIKNK